MTFTVLYDSISNATASGLTTALTDQNISYSKIISIVWNGSAFVCFYVKSQ